MTYKIVTYRFLTWRSALIGYSKQWIAQCQDNATLPKPRCVWRLGLYILATTMVITDLWQCTLTLYSIAPLGGCQHHDLISHSVILGPTSPCPTLIMQSTWIRSDKYQFVSHWFDSTRVLSHTFESPDLPKWETDAQLIRPFRLAVCGGHCECERMREFCPSTPVRVEVMHGCSNLTLHSSPHENW